MEPRSAHLLDDLSEIIVRELTPLPDPNFLHRRGAGVRTLVGGPRSAGDHLRGIAARHRCSHSTSLRACAIVHHPSCPQSSTDSATMVCRSAPLLVVFIAVVLVNKAVLLGIHAEDMIHELLQAKVFLSRIAFQSLAQSGSDFNRYCLHPRPPIRPIRGIPDRLFGILRVWDVSATRATADADG